MQILFLHTIYICFYTYSFYFMHISLVWSGINLYRTNVAASAMQPCTRCWPNVAVSVLHCMHLVFQLSPCLLETETQRNSTVVPTKDLAFVRSHYVIYGSLGFDIIYTIFFWTILNVQFSQNTTRKSPRRSLRFKEPFKQNSLLRGRE